MAKLRMIPDGEKFSTSDTMADKANPEVWISRYAFRTEKGAPRYEKVTRWDFTGVSREDLIRMCCADRRIWAQSKLRDLGQSAVDNDTLFAEVNVLRDCINATRAPADPVEAAIRAFMRLGHSEADARALVAKSPLVVNRQQADATVALEPQDDEVIEQ